MSAQAAAPAAASDQSQRAEAAERAAAKLPRKGAAASDQAQCAEAAEQAAAQLLREEAAAEQAKGRAQAKRARQKQRKQARPCVLATCKTRRGSAARLQASYFADLRQLAETGRGWQWSA